MIVTDLCRIPCNSNQAQSTSELKSNIREKTYNETRSRWKGSQLWVRSESYQRTNTYQPEGRGYFTTLKPTRDSQGVLRSYHNRDTLQENANCYWNIKTPQQLGNTVPAEEKRAVTTSMTLVGRPHDTATYYSVLHWEHRKQAKTNHQTISLHEGVDFER